MEDFRKICLSRNLKDSIKGILYFVSKNVIFLHVTVWWCVCPLILLIQIRSLELPWGWKRLLFVEEHDSWGPVPLPGRLSNELVPLPYQES